MTDQRERLIRLIHATEGRLPESGMATVRRKVSSIETAEIRTGAFAQFILGYILLDPRKLSLLSDLAVMAVIAHEFAHAFLDASITPVIMQNDDYVEVEGASTDAEADNQVVTWGLAAELEAFNREWPVLKDEIVSMWQADNGSGG